MASWGQMGAGSRVVLGVGGAAAVAAVGLVGWWVQQTPAPMPEDLPDPVPIASAVDPAGEATTTPDVAPKQAVPPAIAPDLAAGPPTEPAAPVGPSFDLVRVEADGAAQVAGRAAPGAQVLVQVDGITRAEAAAADGSFVALFTLPPNPQPSLLSLVMRLPDGREVPGRETVALAPIAGPVIASAEPAPKAIPVPEPVAVPDVVAAADAVAAVPDAIAVAEPAAVPEPVAVPQAPAALLVTDQGVKVLQSSEMATDVASVETAEPVADAATVTIDTIAYTPEGAVQFGGRGAVGQVVRLYLDNAALAEVTVPAGGQWALTKADIAPGIYTLRADLVDAAGKVSARFETPFKRETVETLAAAVAPDAPAQTAAPVAEPAPAVVAETAPAPVAAPVAVLQPPAAPATAPTAEPLEVAAAEVSQPAVPAQPAEGGIALPGVVPETGLESGPEAGPAIEAVAQPAAVVPDAAPVAAKAPVIVTVQPGFTLWAIARDQLGDGVMYVQVYDANKDKIRDPDLIYPGQVFTVPAEP